MRNSPNPYEREAIPFGHLVADHSVLYLPMSACKQHMADITELLGKLHNQKIWYADDPDKPYVPKG